MSTPIKVSIPETIEAATGALEGIEALLRAKGWERAAIVYAFTANQQGSQTDQRKVADRLGINEFARLGISGLTTKDSVQLYRSLWAEHGDPDIGPGDTVILPELDFPPTRTGTDGYNTIEGAKRTISKMDPAVRSQALSELASEEPEIAEAVVEAVIANPDLYDDAERRIPRVETPEVPKHPHNIDDCYEDISGAFHHMLIDLGVAIEHMEEAIQNGWRFGELEWNALTQAPGLTWKESLVEFGKLVAMVEIDKARI